MAAPPDLARWVESLWILRGAIAPEGESILPDGRMELVFHFGEPPESQPCALIAGQMTEALQLPSCRRMDALGVRLHPEASG